MNGCANDPFALRNDSEYAAALDELDDLALSEPDTPPGRRFDELVLLIEEYEARKYRHALLPRWRRHPTTRTG